MYDTIELMGKKVELVGNAATAVRYKQVFHEDLLVFFVEGVKDATDTDYIEVAQKLGYIMMLQAQKKDFSKVNFETYISWLEGLDQFELSQLSWDIIKAYRNNQCGLSESKKKEEQRSAE